MAINHGIYVTQQASAVSSPNTADTGIPFVIGAVPLAPEKVVMPQQPEDAAETQAEGTADVQAEGTTDIQTEPENQIQDGVPVLCTSYEEAVKKLGYDDDWKSYPVCEFLYSHFKVFGRQPVIVAPLGKGAGAEDVVAAVETVDLCLPMFNLVPDLIVAPGYSQDRTVAAAMAAKAVAVGGSFRAKALIDLEADSYEAAITEKNGGGYNENQIACWPCAKIGDHIFHASTIVAGCIAATDAENGGIPYESPSNKSAGVEGICLADGTAVHLTHAQANLLNAAGIVTLLNFMGSLVVWGNYTACYPQSTDVKDYFIPVSRMFDFVNNTLIKTFWSKLDQAMNRRLIDSILDSANIWLNGLVGSGYLLGARVEMNESENPTESLMAGIIKLHVYITPPSPMQELDFVLEYDASYVETALSS